MKNTFLTILLLVLFTGCASLGPSFQPESKMSNVAQVYIYRPSHFTGGGGTPDVFVDGNKVGEIPNGGYLPVTVTTAGDHKISIKGTGYSLGSVILHAKVDREYYARVDMTMNNGFEENAQTASRVNNAGNPTGGAVGGAMTSAFFASKPEIQEMLKNWDQGATSKPQNPGFFFVNSDFALREIRETKRAK